MRRTVPALIGSLLIGSCVCDAATAQSSRWGPFGRRDTEASQPRDGEATPEQVPSRGVGPQAPSQYYPADDEPERRWMIDSPLAKVSWPQFHLPEMPKPQLPRPQLWPKKSEVDAARNAWVEQDPTAAQPSPLQAMTDGVRRVGDSTRAAWDKTVDALTPGDNARRTSSRVARRDMERPWWKRMFAVEDPQPQGPQTVTEWMAQERVDP
jgi:hypothetical protein